MEHLNQQQIQAYFEELLEHIQAKYYPINVQIQPDADAEINNCFNNVARKVAASGGSTCYGWALLPQRHILEAEKHAIWKTPEGQYVDITPRPLPITMIQFVIDDDFKYSGQLIGNVRVNITDNEVVDDWIFVCAAIDSLYSNYAERIDDNRVVLPERIAPYLKGLETFVKNFEPFVMAGGRRGALCFCGNPLFYKDCHGLGLQEAIAKDLENIANDNPKPLNDFKAPPPMLKMELVTLTQMDYIIDSNTLDFFWSALQESPNRPKRYYANRLFQRVVQKGWAFRSDVEDMLDWFDTRLSSYKFNAVEFSKSVGIYWEPICFRPKARSNFVVEYDAIRVEDLVLFLIILERIGFHTDATEYVQLLLPAIKSRKKQVFSNAELEIFWFHKTRHKHAGITLMLANSSRWGEIIAKAKTDTGYKITLKSGDDETPAVLKIGAPKYRDRGKPVRTVCPDCGVEWHNGDPDSSFMHREEHKILMTFLDPKPSLEFIEEKKSNNDPELVTIDSPKWKHMEMYLRARAFKREFGYDFIQWFDPRGESNESDDDGHGFLFANEAGAIVGACAFRDRTGENQPKHWGLQWIWLCPKERRSGHLAAQWKLLRERFGDFTVEAPVSDAMKAFLAKHGDSALLNYPK